MAQQNRVGSVHTTVRNRDGVLSVVYHSTEVVKADAESITLDSGGWRTATTKTRINQAANEHGLGFSIFQKAGAWFVNHQGHVLSFRDGMTIAR